MKTFKLIDYWLQITAISLSLLLFVAGIIPFYYAYFIVGGIQLLSMLVHEAAHFFVSAHTARRKYHNIAYIIVACMILGTWIAPFLYIFFPMFFLAPFMAAYYLRMCYKETYMYLKRPLSILK
jgi:hypothetical protein